MGKKFNNHEEIPKGNSCQAENFLCVEDCEWIDWDTDCEYNFITCACILYDYESLDFDVNGTYRCQQCLDAEVKEKSED